MRTMHTQRTSPSPLSLVVLLSGGGSNLKHILKSKNKNNNFIILSVISDRESAAGLRLAQQHHITTHVLDPADYDNRAAWNKAVCHTLSLYAPDLIVCAGFMRILGTEVVSKYTNRIINIHPSLLPSYPGNHTHERVLADGITEHGATVHMVIDQLDQGAILRQASTKVSKQDTLSSLDRKIKVIEHRILPEVIQWYATGKRTPGEPA
jgi:phosphoribosylglycinamide formyltransferase-1